MWVLKVHPESCMYTNTQVTISAPSGAMLLHKPVGSSGHRLIEALLLGHHSSVADAAMKIPEVNEEIFRLVSVIIEAECILLCQKLPPSQFRHVPVHERS